MERLQDFFMNDFTHQDMSHIRPIETTEGEGNNNDYSQMMLQSNPSQGGGLIHLHPVSNSY